MFKVQFTKTFVNGSIQGIEFTDALHFATAAAAQDFVNHLKAHDVTPVKAIGGADYTCSRITMEQVEAKYIDIE